MIEKFPNAKEPKGALRSNKWDWKYGVDGSPGQQRNFDT
jgi:hypothetical protein